MRGDIEVPTRQDTGYGDRAGKTRHAVVIAAARFLAMRILSPNPTIQLWASQFGGDGVLPETVPALAAALPTKPESHPVPGAAHFAFLAPCSPQLAKAAPEICLDGNGFDRAAFHREMNGESRRILRRALERGGFARQRPENPLARAWIAVRGSAASKVSAEPGAAPRLERVLSDSIVLFRALNCSLCGP